MARVHSRSVGRRLVVGVSAVFVMVLAGVAYVATDAPELWDGFRQRSLPLVGASIVAGFLSLYSLARERYRTAEDARRVAAERGAGFEAVGLTPWQPAFPTPAVTGLRIAAEFREPTQQATEAPMVRIFEVR